MNVIINVYRGVARLLLMHAIGTSLAFWIYTIVQETAGAIAIADEYEGVDRDANRTGCLGPDTLNFIHRNISPYLYPFVIEFCILIVGIWYMIWANINHCPEKLSAPGHGHHGHENGALEHDDDQHGKHVDNKRNGSIGTVATDDHCGVTTEHEDNFKSNIVVHADCHASSRGLFAGLILLVVTIVFIILFFIAVQDE